MITITWKVPAGAAIGRFIVLPATLVLAALVLTEGALAQQPTLKDVIEGKAKEEKEAAETKVIKSESKPKQKSVKPVIPDDEFDRGSPRTSVQGFLKAASNGDYQRAAQYLDLQRLPSANRGREGPKLARELNIVLERALWIDLDQLSMDPKGEAEDGLPSYRDLVGRIEKVEKPVNVLLQRVPRGDGVFIWKFSSATVAEIPQLYSEFGYGYIGEVLPTWFFDIRVLGIHAWWWIGLLVFAVLIYFVVLAAMRLILILIHWSPITLSPVVERVFTGPGALLLYVLLLRAGLNLLGPSVLFQVLMQTWTVPIIAVTWMLMRLVDVFFSRVAERLRRRDQTALTVVLPPIGNGVKIVLIVIAVIVWLDNIGFNVTTLLAGLGVGGLAVALAAQKSIENLIGAITLYAAQPVRVGDFCRFRDTVGTVEEIGLRSTRVRTLDRTLMSIPSGEFVNLHLENFTKRDKIWFHPRLRLRYDTTPDQIRYILVEIQKLLYAHPKVQSDSASVRFMEFGTYSLDLDVFAYVPVTDYGEFKEITEDLNLRIIDIITEAGSGLALPVQTMIQESGPGHDEQRSRVAEGQVQAWREQNALCLPKYPQEKIKELGSSLAYPPAGSIGSASGV